MAPWLLEYGIFQCTATDHSLLEMPSNAHPTLSLSHSPDKPTHANLTWSADVLEESDIRLPTLWWCI